MHLIHDQQAAGQQGVAHVGMAHLERTEQGLVYRAYRNGSGQKALGRFSHPALVRFLVRRIVGPLNFEIWQADFFLIICCFVTGQCPHHHRRISWP